MAGVLPAIFLGVRRIRPRAAAGLPSSGSSRVSRNETGTAMSRAAGIFFITFVHAIFTTSFVCLFTNVFDVIARSPAISCVYRMCNAD
jgi:hypothetical protein